MGWNVLEVKAGAPGGGGVPSVPSSALFLLGCVQAHCGVTPSWQGTVPCAGRIPALVPVGGLALRPGARGLAPHRAGLVTLGSRGLPGQGTGWGYLAHGQQDSRPGAGLSLPHRGLGLTSPPSFSTCLATRGPRSDPGSPVAADCRGSGEADLLGTRARGCHSCTGSGWSSRHGPGQAPGSSQVTGCAPPTPGCGMGVPRGPLPVSRDPSADKTG